MQPRDVASALLGAARKKAAQQAVLLVAHLAYAAHHARERHADHHQRVRGEHHARLERFGHHLGRARLREARDVRLVARAGDDRHRRVERMDMREHPQCRIDVGKADDHGRGARDARRDQRLPARAVGEDHVLARERRLAHALGIEVERHITHALGFQQPREALAVAAVAEDDDVALRAHRLRGHAVHFERAQHPFRARQPQHDGVGGGDDEGRREHREDHRREERLQELLRHHARVTGERQQHEAELAAVRERECHAQRRAAGDAEELGEERDQHELAADERDEEERDESGVRRYGAQVEEHSHRDEEEPEQDVAVGPDVLLHLEAVLGLGHQHAGEERAEHER